MSLGEFESNFTKIVGALEEEKDISFNFHSNTLEESFIAILKDSENSGDSLGETVLSSREDHSFGTYGFCCKFILQLWGIFLRQLYFHKSIFLQSFIIYNINILIVLIAFAFNQLITQKLVENISATAAEPQTPPPADQQSQTNMLVQLMQGYFIMATAFIHAPVYEKEKKIRALLNTRGVSWIVYWMGTFLFDFLVFNLNLLVVSQWVLPEAVAQIGWLSLFKLGIGMILFAYCCSFLFEKVKTASTWFSLINVMLGMMLIPMIIFAKDTFFGKLEVLKYVYPYFDLTAQVFLDNGPNAQMAQMAGIVKP
jgi:hypothetical protein